jgi:hypothetical protein
MSEATIAVIEDIPFVDPSTRAIISQILEHVARQDDRLAAVEEENRQLREEVDALKYNLRTLGVWTAPQKVEDLWEWVEDLDKTRTKTRTSTANAEGHLNRLFEVMTTSGMRQISTTNGARLLGITARHLRRLKPLIAADKRFRIVQDPHHRQRHLIRLSET